LSNIDKNYHNLLDEILQKGYWYDDPKRRDVKRLEIPSYTFRHEFKDGFPAITTKKLNYHSVVTELIWFLKGDTNIKYLLDNNCNIWNKDAYNYSFKEGYNRTVENFIDQVKIGNFSGNLGPVYGHQWRNSNGVDQISNLITNLKEQPLATDHIVSSWNPADLKDMALPPCHDYFQIIVRPLSFEERLKLSKYSFNIKLDEQDIIFELEEENISKYGFELHWHQRSVDTFLGLPFNIASYATLALIIEKLTEYKALAIQGDLKKVHLYDNSIDAVKEQLSRDVNKYDNIELMFKDEFHYITDKSISGELSLDKIISEMKPDWFKLNNYESYPYIKVEMNERNETNNT